MKMMKKNNSNNQTANRPYYTAQINGDNCYFDIRLNDLLVWRHTKEGGISTNFPLNLNIFNSGNQKLKINVTPRVKQGELLLTKYASLEVEVRLYKDVDDPILDYESILKYVLDVPEEGMPLDSFSNVFFANVPYNIPSWQNALDLKNIDNIEMKALSFYQKYWQALNSKDLESVLRIIQLSENNCKNFFYFSDERVESRVNSMKELINDPNFKMEKLNSNILVYYANDRAVSLETLKGTSALFGIINSGDKEKNDTINFDVRLMFNKETNLLEPF